MSIADNSIHLYDGRLSGPIVNRSLASRPQSTDIAPRGREYTTQQPRIGSARNILGEQVTNIYGGSRATDGAQMLDLGRRDSLPTAIDGQRIPERMYSSGYVGTSSDSRPVYTVRPNSIRPPSNSYKRLTAGINPQQTIPTILGNAPGGDPYQLAAARLMASDGGHSIGSGDGNINHLYNRDTLLSPQAGANLGKRIQYADNISDIGSRAARSSGHSNRANEYEWTNLNSNDINRNRVNNEQYIVKTRQDTEVEQEFQLSKWREEQARANQAPSSQNQAIRNQYFDTVPGATSFARPTESLDIKSVSMLNQAQRAEPQRPQPIESSFMRNGSQNLPSIYSQTPEGKYGLRNQTDSMSAERFEPNQQQNRILNSDDLKSLIAGDNDSIASDNMTAIGRTAQGQNVYGFDQTGQPIIHFDKTLQKPVYGYTHDTKSAVYGFSNTGKPYVAFDESGRAVIGFSGENAPVYGTRSKYFVTDFDDDNNSVLGFTRENKPIYDISPAGYVALGIDRTTRHKVYGYNWQWKPVFEPELRVIEHLLAQKTRVAKDEHGNRVYGFDEHNNPIFTYTSDELPIFGYNWQKYPIFGINPQGHLVLTFDGNKRPVYGFDVNESPIYDLNTIPTSVKIYFPPGNELDIREAGKVYDVWGRPVQKDKVSKRANEQNTSRRFSDASINVDLYDRSGKPMQRGQELHDGSGRPLPQTQLVTDAQGRLITPNTPVFDKQGQAFPHRPQQPQAPMVQNAFNHKGQPVGSISANSIVINQSHQPVAIAISPNKVVSLLHPHVLQTAFIRGQEVFDQQGQPLGKVEADGSVVDMVGVLLGSAAAHGLVQPDQDLVQYHQNRLMDLSMHYQGAHEQSIHSAVHGPGYEQGKSMQSIQPSERFKINSQGLLRAENGIVIGQVNSIEPQLGLQLHPQAFQVVKDQSGRVSAQVLNSGEILSLEGKLIGTVDHLPSRLQAPQLPDASHQVDNAGLLRDIGGSILGMVVLTRLPDNTSAPIVVDQSGQPVAKIAIDGSIVAPTGQVIGKAGPPPPQMAEQITQGPPPQHLSGPSFSQPPQHFEPKPQFQQPQVPSSQQNHPPQGIFAQVQPGPAQLPQHQIDNEGYLRDSLGTFLGKVVAGQIPDHVFASVINQSGVPIAAIGKEGLITTPQGQVIGSITSGSQTPSAFHPHQAHGGEPFPPTHSVDTQSLIRDSVGQIIGKLAQALPEQVGTFCKPGDSIIEDQGGQIIGTVTRFGELISLSGAKIGKLSAIEAPAVTSFAPSLIGSQRPSQIGLPGGQQIQSASQTSLHPPATSQKPQLSTIQQPQAITPTFKIDQGIVLGTSGQPLGHIIQLAPHEIDPSQPDVTSVVRDHTGHPILMITRTGQIVAINPQGQRTIVGAIQGSPAEAEAITMMNSNTVATVPAVSRDISPVVTSNNLQSQPHTPRGAQSKILAQMDQVHAQPAQSVLDVQIKDGQLVAQDGKSLGQVVQDNRVHQLNIPGAHKGVVDPSGQISAVILNDGSVVSTMGSTIARVGDSSVVAPAPSEFIVTAEGYFYDKSGEELGKVFHLHPHQLIAGHPEIANAVFETTGKIAFYLSNYGQVVSAQGQPIGSASPGARPSTQPQTKDGFAAPNAIVDLAPVNHLFFMSDQGKPVAAFNRVKGVLISPQGVPIGRYSSNTRSIVDSQGKELCRFDHTGNLVHGLDGFKVKSQYFQEALRGVPIAPETLQKLKSESKLSQSQLEERANKINLTGYVLLDDQTQPIGTLDDKRQIVDVKGERLGRIDAEGYFNPEANFGLKTGALADKTGRILAKFSKETGFVLADGRGLFEPLDATSSSSAKFVAGYFQDDKNQLLDREGQIVGKITGDRILNLDGQCVAKIDQSGNIKDTAGNRIDQSGATINAQGVSFGRLHLLSKKDELIPMAKNVPVIADVGGHKIIGFNENGDFIIGVEDNGKPIFGKVRVAEDGTRILAIDIKGNSLPQNYLDEIIKVSKEARKSSVKPQNQPSVVEEEDEHEESDIAARKSSDVLAKPIKSEGSIHRGDSGFDFEDEADENEEAVRLLLDKDGSVFEGLDFEGMDRDEMIQNLASRSPTKGGTFKKGQLVKTESFITVPEFNSTSINLISEQTAADKVKLEAELKDNEEKLNELIKYKSSEVTSFGRVGSAQLSQLELRKSLLANRPHPQKIIKIQDTSLHLIELPQESRFDPDQVTKQLELKKQEIKERKKRRMEEKRRLKEEREEKKSKKKSKRQIGEETPVEEAVEEIIEPEEGTKIKKKKKKHAQDETGEDKVDADKPKKKKKKRTAEETQEGELDTESKPKKKKTRKEGDTAKDEHEDDDKPKKKKKKRDIGEETTVVDEGEAEKPKKKKKKATEAQEETLADVTGEEKPKKKKKKVAIEDTLKQDLAEEKPKKKKKKTDLTDNASQVVVDEDKPKKKKAEETINDMAVTDETAEKRKRKKKKVEEVNELEDNVAFKKKTAAEEIPAYSITENKPKKKRIKIVDDTLATEAAEEKLKKKKKKAEDTSEEAIVEEKPRKKSKKHTEV